MRDDHHGHLLPPTVSEHPKHLQPTQGLVLMLVHLAKMTSGLTAMARAIPIRCCCLQIVVKGSSPYRPVNQLFPRRILHV